MKYKSTCVLHRREVCAECRESGIWVNDLYEDGPTEEPRRVKVQDTGESSDNLGGG